MHVTAEAKNPASCVTAGIARIPAPTCGITKDDKTNITVVPATRKIELVTLPDIQMRNSSITVHLKGKTNMHKEVERSMLCASPGSCFMVAWLRLEKSRSSCCCCEPDDCFSAYCCEHRHRCSLLLGPPVVL
uniref:Uncharacterized protein n=2 Tax=Oryza TaxID=4527 RepID=A0A0E0I5A9_ORYNI